MISIGPLALAIERLIAVLGILAFITAAHWLGRKHGKGCENGAWRALIVGLIAARAGFVAQNWPAYAAEPLTVLYVWQGGFSPLIGLAGAAIVLALTLRRSPAILPMGIALAGCGALAFIATTVFVTSAQRPLPPGLIVHSLTGEPHSLDEWEGKPLVINLWATWCPPCRREMPMMVEEAARSPIPILLVNQGESADQVRLWLAVQRLSPAQALLDANHGIAAATGSAGLPATLFIDSKGMIRTLHVGEISRAALLADMRELD